MRRTLLGLTAMLITLAATACSVTTPRNEVASGPGDADVATTAAGTAGYDSEAATSAASDAGTTAATSSGDGATAGAAQAPGGSPAAPAAPGAQSAAGATPAPSSGTPAAGGSPTTPAAPSGVRVTGVGDKEITVSIIAGFSGPLAAMVNRAYDGILTWQEDVNDAGGFHGRKVVLKKVDHKETADGGVAACKEALSNGSLFALVPEGIDAGLTAISCLDAAGMPNLYYSPTADPKWKVSFSTQPTSATAGPQMATYVRSVLKGSGKKIGVMYVNQAAYKSLVDTFVPEARRLGLSVPEVEALEPNQASFTAPLLRMKNAGVEILVISATAEAVGIIRDAKSIGFTAQFTGWGFAFDFITVAGRNLFEGVTALRSYASTDTPAFQRYAARMQARGRGRSRADDLEGFTAYGYALILGEVLNKTGPRPNRQAVVAGAETVKNFNSGVMAPFSWTPGDHVGAHATFPIVCCNDDWTWKSAGAPRITY
jgi:branched-chain amino acid transport system substrate-binding protein